MVFYFAEAVDYKDCRLFVLKATLWLWSFPFQKYILMYNVILSDMKTFLHTIQYIEKIEHPLQSATQKMKRSRSRPTQPGKYYIYVKTMDDE